MARKNGLERLCNRQLGYSLLWVAVLFCGRAYANGVIRVDLPVSDLDTASSLFEKTLGFKKNGSEEDLLGEKADLTLGIFAARLRRQGEMLGTEQIQLWEFRTPVGRDMPRDSKSNDRWFQHLAIVVSDMDRAFEAVKKLGVRFVSPEPQTLPSWNPNAGGIRAFYFQDRDGHPLELIQYPKGKGQDRWQEKDPLFLGIDHTAIAVSNTERSTSFYKLLGLEVRGKSENYGPEQERLNHVPGAHLKITAMRGDQGPGVEFLEYGTPTGGRPYPRDSHANDLWQWTIEICVPSIERVLKDLERTHGSLVSPHPGEAGKRLVRDPDGHAILLREDCQK